MDRDREYWLLAKFRIDKFRTDECYLKGGLSSANTRFDPKEEFSVQEVWN